MPCLQPVPGAVLACKIRRGRPPEQRERLAAALFDTCVQTLGLDPLILAVEFTQDAGDENYLRALVDGVPRAAWAATGRLDSSRIGACREQKL